MRRLLVLLASLLVAACGSIGAAQAHAITLAYGPGDTYRYTLHAALDYTVGAQGLSIPLKLDFTGKEAVNVKSVDSKGVADLSIALTDMTIKTTVNGTTSTSTTNNPATVEMQIGPDGRILSVNGNALGGSALPGLGQGGLITAILPDGAVKPGDTWTKEYDQTNPMGSGTVHVTTKNRYARDEKVGNVNAAVVQSNIASSLNLTFDTSALAGRGGTSLLPSSSALSDLKSLTMTGTTTSDVTSWIDASAHRVVKSHSTGKVNATMTLTMAPGPAAPGLTGPISIKGSQTMDMNPA